MLSWAQRTARWTVKTLPFSFGRAGSGDLAATSPASQCPPQAERADARGTRRQALHERGQAAPGRGRHAAPGRSRRARVRDAD